MASGQCQLFSDNDRQVAQEVYQETQAYIQQCLKDGPHTADDIRKQTIEDPTVLSSVRKTGPHQTQRTQDEHNAATFSS